jgi:hypothetical protein
MHTDSLVNYAFGDPMDRYTFVIIIVGLSIAYSLLNNYFKFKSKSDQSMKELDSRIQKIEDLEKRIQVLEKIVTDNKYDLKREIDDLK